MRTHALICQHAGWVEEASCGLSACVVAASAVYPTTSCFFSCLLLRHVAAIVSAPGASPGPIVGLTGSSV